MGIIGEIINKNLYFFVYKWLPKVTRADEVKASIRPPYRFCENFKMFLELTGKFKE